MKIAVVSPGRSHLLDMSIMHIKNGHDVTFYTMVSKKRCEQFGFPADKVVSFFITLCFSVTVDAGIFYHRMTF